MPLDQDYVAGDFRLNTSASKNILGIHYFPKRHILISPHRKRSLKEARAAYNKYVDAKKKHERSPNNQLREKAQTFFGRLKAAIADNSNITED